MSLQAQLQAQLQAAQKALKAKDFETAIAQFQAISTQPECRPEGVSEAKMWLAIAYKQSGQPELAQPIAQELEQSSESVTRRWATQFLAHLDLPESAEAQSPEAYLEAGQHAFKEKRYPEAIQHLEAYCQTQALDDLLESGQAYLLLAKAYKSNAEPNPAMQICQRLAKHPEAMVQMGAMQLLAGLEAMQHLPSSFESISESAAESGSGSGSAENRSGRLLQPRSLEDLRSFFRKNLLFTLSEYEKRRKVTATSIHVATLLFLVVIGGLGILAYALVRDIGWISLRPLSLLCAVFLVALWAWIGFITSAMETYVSGFKTKVIERLVAFLDPSGRLQYTVHQEPQAELEHLLHSQLFPTPGKRFYIDQDDCVAGKLGETELFFSEISAYTEKQGLFNHRPSHASRFTQDQPWILTSHGAGQNFLSEMINQAMMQTLRAVPYVLIRLIKRQQIHYSQFQDEIIENKVTRKRLFKGLFFRARFNKRVKGKTIVLPDNLLTRTAWLNSHRGASVKLEDPEFEQYFEVYGDDQVESRYALSTNLMAQLVALRKKSQNRPVYVSLVEDTIYIAIASDRDLFEPRLYRSILDFNLVRQYFEDFQLMAGIVDELNLNRRIWMSSAERSLFVPPSSR